MSDVVVVGLLAAFGFASIVIDIRTRRVPNVLTLALAVTGVGLAALHMTEVSVWSSVAGLFLGLALMLPGHVIGATGAGDVKLFAAAGTLLGPAGVVFAFLYATLAGGLLAIVVALARGQLIATLERL